MKLFLPSWNGDFRLEGNGEAASVLLMHEPTAQERVVVGTFLAAAKKSKWWKGDAPEKGQPYTGSEMVINIEAPLAKASKALIKVARPADRTLTAVKFASGKMEVVEGAGVAALEKVEKTVAAAAAEEKAGGAGGGTAAAASVKRPTPCCPQCMPGAIKPATEVLLSFLSPAQHEQWMSERAMLVEGGLSGHQYLIAHRNSSIAQKVGKICFDVTDQTVIHFHDWSVPPEEEVLAAKLIMEHAEPWLRNEATTFGARLRYKNPFGGGGDGVETSSFVNGLGSTLLSMLNVGRGTRPIA